MTGCSRVQYPSGHIRGFFIVTKGPGFSELWSKFFTATGLVGWCYVLWTTSTNVIFWGACLRSPSNSMLYMMIVLHTVTMGHLTEPNVLNTIVMVSSPNFVCFLRP